MFLDPVDLEPPARLLTPSFSGSSDPRSGRYIPGPLAEGMVRVVLRSSSYEDPAACTPYDEYPFIPMAYEVYDLPAETVEHWNAARVAYEAEQGEIEATISARATERRG